MARRGNGRSSHSALPLRVRAPAPSSATRSASSTTETAAGSQNPSTQNPEADKTEEEVVNHIAALTLDVPLIPFMRKRKVPSKPFPFLSLPAEVRIKVYEHYFDDENAEDVVDLGPDNYKRYHGKLRIMRVNRQVHDEATHVFYSTRAFRIFPTHPGKYFKTKRPLLARLKKCQRECITSLQLRLGPGWSAPPRGWLVNDALGLKELTNVRKLDVFVECDPSDGVFKGFRRGDGYYEGFSRQLMSQVVESMPAVTHIEFDGYSGVKKKGAMMQGLLEEAKSLGLTVQWGPEHGWTDVDTKDDEVVVNEKNPFMQGPLVLPDMADLGHYNVQVSA